MKMPFLFGIHCHQPAENFHHVVDWAVEKSYAPFIAESLEEKDFKFAVHYSGWLLDYIRQHHADVFRNLQKLASNGQVEFFTGGFYEPVLSAIPSDDRRGQIKMLSQYIKKYFGQTPTGMWLTERVWDPAIVPDIVEVGVENVIVDDYHLIAAGFPNESIISYFVTEQDGARVNLFPIDKMVRYLTPFKPEKELLNYLEGAKKKNHKLIACFDDGEKFGIWPSTYEWVYEKGWLKRFIEAVQASSEVEFAHYDEAVRSIKPAGIAYLPITSYMEMGEWSLFASQFKHFEKLSKYLAETEFKADAEQFLRGSIWKNFFVKYPESNRLHKRTLDLSLRGRPFKRNKQFQDLLYRAECNDSLWHGLFGGIYLPSLRDSAKKPLIQAEALYENLANVKIPAIDVRDIDFDGYDEVYAREENFNALFVSRDCGQLASLELKDRAWDILGVIARRKEGYHSDLIENSAKKAAENEGSEPASIHEKSRALPDDMKDRIAYDWYIKNCFIDHFTDCFSVDRFEKCNFFEYGDIANGPAEFKSDRDKIIFTRRGGLYKDGVKRDINVVKTYALNKKGISFSVALDMRDNFPCVYVMENNLHFADWTKVLINGEPLSEKGELMGKKFVIKDPFLNKSIVFEYENEVKFGWFVIYTVSQSESGVDLTAQGVTFIAGVDFSASMAFNGCLFIK